MVNLPIIIGAGAAATIVSDAAASMSAAADAMKDASDTVLDASNFVAEEAMGSFLDGTGKFRPSD